MLSEAFGDPSPAPSLPPVTAVSGTTTTTMTTTTSSCTMVAAAAAASVTVAANAASVTTVATTTTPTTPVPERRRSARKNPNDGGQIQEEEEEEMKVEPPETPTHTGPMSSEDVMEINQLYTAIISAKDGERDISEVFQRLPPRSVSINSAPTTHFPFLFLPNEDLENYFL